MQTQIEQIYSDIQAGKKAEELSSTEKKAILDTIEQLDLGKIRVCEKIDGTWVNHEWIKKSVLLYFRIQKNDILKAEDFSYFDKVPVKKWRGHEGVRVVPPATARYGSFIASGVILMPSYVNIGAYVDSGTMVDTWATVGSCAQIGKNVHLSGGVGIGGVLEPLQAKPVIIEDNCFLGSRAIVVEGAHLEEGVVLGAGVTITASTKILDVTQNEVKEYTGFVPKNCVVIPGTRNKKFPAGDFGVPCALIIGQRKESTDLKTSLNQALRDYGVSV